MQHNTSARVERGNVTDRESGSVEAESKGFDLPNP